MDIAKTHLLLLLQLIKTDGSLYPLVKRGLEYSQIAKAIRFLKKKGLVVDMKDGLQLTDKGQDKVIDLNKHFGKRGSDGWILSADEYRISKIAIEDIYLPKRRKK